MVHAGFEKTHTGKGSVLFLEINKGTFRRLLLLITSAMLIGFALMHMGTVFSVLKTVLAILSPILLGLCIAFVVSVPMRALERLWDKLFMRRSMGEGTGKTRKTHRPIRQILRRPICMILSFVLIAGVLFAVIFMILPEFLRTLEDFVSMLPSYLRKAAALWEKTASFLEQYNIFLPALDVARISSFNIDGILNTVKGFFTEWGQHIIDTTLSITTSMFGAIFDVVLAFVFSIYMLAQKETLTKQIRRCLQALFSEHTVLRLCEFAGIVNRTFTNFVSGQMTEAVIIAILCGIGMRVLGIPYAFVVSVLVGFTALIPVFGAFIGTAIGALLILLVSPIKAFWFVIFIIVLQQLEGNLIYPRVVGKSVGLPGIVVLAAVTVGSSFGGVIGMLLAVPVCSVIFCICKEAVDNAIERKEAALTSGSTAEKQSFGKVLSEAIADAVQADMLQKGANRKTETCVGRELRAAKSDDAQTQAGQTEKEEPSLTDLSKGHAAAKKGSFKKAKNKKGKKKK